jgi:LPXTG-site transpeptidase (sortase) family protein
MVAGLGMMVFPTIQEFAGQWGQHDRAVSQDQQSTRFALAMADAYEVVVSDFESAIVSFEVGALPTTTDGRVIGLAGGQPVTDRAVSDPVGEFKLAATLPPPTFEGVSIRIPSIDLDQVVVEGIGREDLKLGPGHYPGTAQPGYAGNVVISGHRTTYTHPFYDLDLLEPGDVIFVDTPRGSYRYVVRTSFVVDPSDLSPLAATESAVLTLTTCTPKNSADQRLILVADLDGEPEGAKSS